MVADLTEEEGKVSTEAAAVVDSEAVAEEDEVDFQGLLDPQMLSRRWASSNMQSRVRCSAPAQMLSTFHISTPPFSESQVPPLPGPATTATQLTLTAASQSAK